MSGTGLRPRDFRPQVGAAMADRPQMNITSSASIGAAVNSASNSDPDTVQGVASTLMLKKALDVQAQGAIALLNALPQQPALATEGSVGRNINTFA